MSKSNIITGLDVGTSKIRAVMISAKGDEESPKVIGIGQADSRGMRKGAVVDIDEITEGIKQAVEEAELMSNQQIDNVYLSIGGSHIGIRENKGLVAVSRADQEVSEEDVSRVIDSASAISLPPNREIIHVVPRGFKLDDEGDIQDPTGMTGARLEVDALIIDGLSPCIKNLTKCVGNLGIKIEDIVLNVLAASQAVLNKRQRELGVLVLDLGGGTAGMAVYEEGKLLHAHVLPIGSSHVTNDIAIGLRTTIDLAEKIKLEHGSALPSEIKKRETIDLSKLDEKEEETVSKKEVAKISEARVQEIFDLVNQELKRIGKERLLPAGVVLTGGGSLMPGIVELAKKRFGLPVQQGTPSELRGVAEKMIDPSLATVIGLAFWGIKMQGSKNHRLAFLPEISSASVTVGNIKKWFRKFLP